MERHSQCWEHRAKLLKASTTFCQISHCNRFTRSVSLWETIEYMLLWESNWFYLAIKDGPSLSTLSCETADVACDSRANNWSITALGHQAFTKKKYLKHVHCYSSSYLSCALWQNCSKAMSAVRFLSLWLLKQTTNARSYRNHFYPFIYLVRKYSDMGSMRHSVPSTCSRTWVWNLQSSCLCPAIA